MLSRPYVIHQTILIISFLKYSNLLIIKKLMNLDYPTYCHYYAFVLLYWLCSKYFLFYWYYIITLTCNLSNIMLLYQWVIYHTVLIISLLKYSNLLTIKKRINLDCLTYYCHGAIILLYYCTIICCLVYCLACYLICNCYLTYCLSHYLTCWLVHCLVYCLANN